MISSKLSVSNDGNLLILGPYSYFHHEGVIELLRPRFFFVILSQRAQPEELNSLKIIRYALHNEPTVTAVGFEA